MKIGKRPCKIIEDFIWHVLMINRQGKKKKKQRDKGKFPMKYNE